MRIDGPRRWYALRVEALAELDEWLAPYRWMWESRLDRLGAHLDTMPDEAAPAEAAPDEVTALDQEAAPHGEAVPDEGDPDGQ